MDEWEELTTCGKVCVGKTGQAGFIGREGTVTRKQQESCPPDSHAAPDRALDLRHPECAIGAVKERQNASP